MFNDNLLDLNQVSTMLNLTFLCADDETWHDEDEEEKRTEMDEVEKWKGEMMKWMIIMNNDNILRSCNTTCKAASLPLQ